MNVGALESLLIAVVMLLIGTWLNRRIGVLGTRGAHHAMAGVLQIDGDELLDVRLVLDDQDPGAHAPGWGLRVWRTSVPLTM